MDHLIAATSYSQMLYQLSYSRLANMHARCLERANVGSGGARNHECLASDLCSGVAVTWLLGLVV